MDKALTEEHIVPLLDHSGPNIFPLVSHLLFFFAVRNAKIFRLHVKNFKLHPGISIGTLSCGGEARRRTDPNAQINTLTSHLYALW